MCVDWQTANLANFDFQDFCMTQGVPLRHFAGEFLFSLVTRRHFAEVLNSMGVGIAGDLLESSLLQPEAFLRNSPVRDRRQMFP
jgi:hypothetical protein